MHEKEIERNLKSLEEEEKERVQNIRKTVLAIDYGKIDVVQIIQKRQEERLSHEKYQLACFLGFAVPFFQMDSELKFDLEFMIRVTDVVQFQIFYKFDQVKLDSQFLWIPVQGKLGW